MILGAAGILLLYHNLQTLEFFIDVMQILRGDISVAEISVYSYSPFPNSRLIPGFSRSLFPKIPEISLAHSILNQASFILGPSLLRNTVWEIYFVNCCNKKKVLFFPCEKNTKRDFTNILVQK